MTFASSRKLCKRFTQSEDTKLKHLVEKYGEDQWIKVSKHLIGRTARQCKDRWFQYLSPNTNLSPMTPEEEKLLVELAVKHNNQWAIIAQYFKSRPPSQLRNKWKTIQNRSSSKGEKAQLGNAEKNIQNDCINFLKIYKPQEVKEKGSKKEDDIFNSVFIEEELDFIIDGLSK